MVNVTNGSATYRIAYGTGGNYRHRTAAQTLWGSAATPVAATLTGLSPHTKYQVRLVVGSGAGVTYSAPRTFTTPKGSRQRTRRHHAHRRARHH
jgi:hypothetical protein